MKYIQQLKNIEISVFLKVFYFLMFDSIFIDIFCGCWPKILPCMKLFLHLDFSNYLEKYPLFNKKYSHLIELGDCKLGTTVSH